jgi:hypothetical protein
MTPHSCPWLLDVEGISETTVVRFLPPAGRDDTIGYVLGSYLLGLAEQSPTHLVLNSGAVDYVNSLLLGKLFALAKKVKSLGGQHASIGDQAWMIVGKSKKCDTTCARPIPRPTPSTLPTLDNTTVSIRNCKAMSRRLMTAEFRVSR